MSEAEAAPPPQTAAQERPTNLVTELRVSGHLMTLDAGLFCLVQTQALGVDPLTGLPGVRVSVPPGAMSRPEAVSISSFRNDGWLSGVGDAALVRVLGGPAQLLVTVYQAQNASADMAPNIQVIRLADAAAASQAARAAGAAAPQPMGEAKVVDMLAHIQGRGDVGAVLGDFLGEKGSKRWIEGFAVAPSKDVAPADIEYQAVLGRDWLSPWVEGGQFCGSRGMALPVLGMRLRLRGAAAEKFDCAYSATFIDGTEIGPVHAGDPCEAESLAPMESFRVELTPRDATKPRGGRAARR